MARALRARQVPQLQRKRSAATTEATKEAMKESGRHSLVTLYTPCTRTPRNYMCSRSRENAEHFESSRPESGLGFRHKYLKLFTLLPSRSRSDARWHQQVFLHGHTATRWTTNNSSNVNLLVELDFKASCALYSVTLPPRNGRNQTFVVYRVVPRSTR